MPASVEGGVTKSMVSIAFLLHFFIFPEAALCFAGGALMIARVHPFGNATYRFASDGAIEGRVVEFEARGRNYESSEENNFREHVFWKNK